MTKKRILVLNGSFCEQPIIETASKMGYYVITTGNAPDLIGHKYADKYIACDYSDKNAILNLVQNNKIDGIIPCANDFGVLTASYVAEKMGWKGLDNYENALLLHHKDKFKSYCKEKNVPSPISEIFKTKIDAINFCKNAIYPIIVKANDLTGGKGIKRANNFKEAQDAINEAFEASRDKLIVVEPFIEGTQHSICVFLVNKKIIVSSSCQSYSFTNPYLIQAETFPSRFIQGSVKQELEQIIENMAEDLNLADGILNIQLILNDNKIYVIELMRRCFGNDALFPYKMVSGFDWYTAYILAALGEDASSIKIQKPEKKYCGHFSLMAKETGILDKVIINKKITDHVFRRYDLIQSGEKIDNPNAQRPVYLYYEYDDIEKMNIDITHYSDWVRVIMK